MGKSTLPAGRGKDRINEIRKATLADDGSGDDGWRVVLLRALVKGDLEAVASMLQAHIDVLSLPLTSIMPRWKLQCESMHWWMLSEATPLFLASAYSHPAIVQWLLLHGADRSAMCYLNQTPLAVVGECCEHTVVPTDTRPALLKRSAECRRLLEAPATIPEAPAEAVGFSCHISTQTVVVRVATPNVKGAATPPPPQTIYTCFVEVTWLTPLSNGAIIEKYDVRYRVIIEEETSAGGDDGDDDAQDGEASQAASASSSANWHTERATHNRRRQQQTLVLKGLQFESIYEFGLRSWNAAGKGEWGRPYKFRTLPSPVANNAKT
ncbi:hypothetical protein Poli38472_005686 [Pythium oligandrum]|uniref:Fibronectin type-III domain-containing protein n=1 Tax=Pythium oligandrum TaxID=41045 RepID=A0A8K1CIG1_PYTOL|nr:hypothetical protein Poli38472_005686 [Pythium oligandrum]|eukprot:TMW63068.1 hypothetical protein Poli38472_005686 [Pythium oligandrum]